MEQRRALDINMHHNNKKVERPKSTFLSWILKSSVTSATVTKEENEDNDSEEARMIKSSSNKIEMRDWDQHNNNMMNSSFSTPTAIGSYTQLNYHVKEKKSLPPPPPPPHINTNPNIIVNHHDHQQVEIPNRRQSNLYTPFHDNDNVHITALQSSSDNNKIFNNNNRRSYYVSNLAPIDTTISNSSLSRSATWQPSTSSTPNNNEHNYNNNIPSSHTSETNHQQQHYLIPTSADIPTRRTSRNYANNPEVQAKLDAMLNSDRTLYLSTVLHNNNHLDSSSTNNNNASIIYRRSTTPGNRII